MLFIVIFGVNKGVKIVYILISKQKCYFKSEEYKTNQTFSKSQINKEVNVMGVREK